MKAIDYKDRLRDTKLEKEIASNLRRMESNDAFEFVMELLDVHLIAALDLARRCLRDKAHFTALLDHGLNNGDASTIKHWIRNVAPHFGTHRLIKVLDAKEEENPQGVARAIYFVGQLIDENDEKSRLALDKLTSKLQLRGLALGPKIVERDGKTLFEPVEPPPIPQDTES